MSISLAPTSLSMGAPAPERAEDIRKAAEGFEQLFLATLLKGARAGLPGDDLTGGNGVNSATQMLDSQLARVAGSSAGFGIAAAIARQFAGPGAAE
jgi:peptidoglycan hydrolase FlgJ